MLFPEFYRSKDQIYYKNLAKETIFVWILGFIFYVASRTKTDLTINIRVNFVFGSFFEQDHLLNLIILGVYAKR